MSDKSVRCLRQGCLRREVVQRFDANNGSKVYLMSVSVGRVYGCRDYIGRLSSRVE
jgi:hypothetical protein